MKITILLLICIAFLSCGCWTLGPGYHMHIDAEMKKVDCCPCNPRPDLLEEPLP